jgi:hypothetical protein
MSDLGWCLYCRETDRLRTVGSLPSGRTIIRCWQCDREWSVADSELAATKAWNQRTPENQPTDDRNTHP